MTKQTTYSEVKNGDKIWLCGILFEVTNIRHEKPTKSCASNSKFVVRFEGKIIDKNNRLFNTDFNGGTYGGADWVPVTLEV